MINSTPQRQQEIADENLSLTFVLAAVILLAAILAVRLLPILL
ncbi:MAG: hypothetical protein WEB00_10605 [Dehalococcoidia bacterium]